MNRLRTTRPTRLPRLSLGELDDPPDTCDQRQ